MAPATRPKITHDNGHLVLGRREPVAGDYAALAKWRAMLNVGETLRPDLTDALAAYRHFLDGGGKPRVFSYERYVMSDVSGQTTLWNAILDFQDATQRIYLKDPSQYQFPVTGNAIPCGAPAGKYPYLSAMFPYPSTENWQKAIGAHQIWISGEVKAHKAPNSNGEVLFEAIMILHAEDRYNFNVSDADIATGLPDSDNGRFERVGWGHQYDHFSTLQRYLKWKGFTLGVAVAVSPNTTRMRQPKDNRRLRNRL
ncbi:MAG: hypothetical protein SF187_04335 [Deltaproteobacteria bacterium]|nr:hypothetical protein [Deltaproteobacteria bacterium]